MARPLSNHDQEEIKVRVAGTSPLSFEVPVGTILKVKKIGPSTASRPSIGGKFKGSGFLLFTNHTKVGRLSPASLNRLNSLIPPTCKVVEVDKIKKRLTVAFR